MVIAIDGPAGAGKSTVARALAERLGFTYLDSGAMYRCVALAVMRAGVDPDLEAAVAPIAADLEIELDGDGAVRLGGEEVGERVRESDVSEVASRVSVHPAVRSAMVGLQRRIIESGDWVAEGRDIGTVVCPGAPLKIFLGAGEGERARRRAAEADEPVETVLAAQRDRDVRDRSREHGALRPAPDAVELDTTELEVDQVVERIAELARRRGLL
jgi:CMP/dCMP kinase